MKTLATMALAALLLTGCGGDYVTSKDIDTAVRLCAPHGGVEMLMARTNQDVWIKAHCVNDGAHFTIRGAGT